MTIFTDVSKVKRLARISNELSDDEIGSYIEDVDTYMIEEYGYYPGRMHTQLNIDRSGSYFLRKDRKPIYSVKQVFVDGSELNAGSFTSVPGSGMILIPSDIESTYDGDSLHIKYIPKMYHNLASWIAAKDVMESQHLISRDGADSPRVSVFNKNINSAIEAINQEVLYRPSKYTKWHPQKGEYVDQLDLGNQID